MLYIGEELAPWWVRRAPRKSTSPLTRLSAPTTVPTTFQIPSPCLQRPPRTLLHAPDCYMDKLAAGPALADHVALDGGVAYNIEQAMHVLDCEAGDVRIVALDRERHAGLFKEIRDAGAQLHLLSDGDVSGAIWAAKDDGPYDMLMGIGAAPEGVISATAIRGVGGMFEGRLMFRSPEEEARAGTMVGDDLTRLWKAHDLARVKTPFLLPLVFGRLPAGRQVEATHTTTYNELIDVAKNTVVRSEQRRPL